MCSAPSSPYQRSPPAPINGDRPGPRAVVGEVRLGRAVVVKVEHGVIDDAIAVEIRHGVVAHSVVVEIQPDRFEPAVVVKVEIGLAVPDGGRGVIARVVARQ